MSIVHDHRELAQRLDLFHFQEEAPGMVFWHPRGFLMYRLLEDAVRRVLSRDGYQEVRTPQILRQPIWEASGHWQHFRDDMFVVSEEGAEAAVKPVSCPGHAQLVKQRAPSYRELPLRLAEFGVVHRNEPSGTLHGLLRLRQFTQDDGHIFATEDQAEAEIERFCRALPPFYRAFGFERLSYVVSTRPASRAGEDALWDRAEAALLSVVEKLGHPHQVQPGGGAFYGPKIELVLRDEADRPWSCGTIQFDFFMPRSFDLRYVASSGERPHVVMLHRAMFGSVERFLALLLERHGAALPPWLAADQAIVLPVSSEQDAWAREVADRFARAGVRARVDDRSASLAKRIALAHHDGAAHVAVVGAREVAERAVTLRDVGTMDLERATSWLAERGALPAFV
ncbi:MAG TPA: threonine--tRNA ligase [Polyangiaceae bacterium]|jgi:threonyl-tRNA synthetase